nr:hypothetical protein [uncultured Romboutsia sp.]
MNNVYIHATSEIHIIDIFGNIVDETDWNEDNHLIYSEFNNSYNTLDDIEYYEVLDFTINEISRLINNDTDLKKSYPNCSFVLENVHVYRVYNSNNEIYF